MPLFKPGWQSNKADRALRAVGKLSDPAKLFEIASSAPLEIARKKAVEQLDDASLLMKLAAGPGSREVALAAAKKLTNQQELEKLAATAPWTDVRIHAVDRLTSQETLASIAQKDANPMVRRAAVRHLTDETILENIALHDSIRDVTSAAVERLRSEKALAHVILGTRDDKLADKAVVRIQDPKRLLMIATGKAPHSARIASARAIADPELIKRLFLTCDNVNVVSPLWDRLEDQNAIIDIAGKAQSSDIRKKAMERITDSSALADIALGTEPTPSGRADAACAIRRIDDSAQLRRIYDHTTDTDVRDQAIQKAGGYLCKGCGKAHWPVEGQTLPCICPECGAENHAFKHVDNVREYRDYSVGSSWDECIRCGKQENYRYINTM